MAPSGRSMTGTKSAFHSFIMIHTRFGKTIVTGIREGNGKGKNHAELVEARAEVGEILSTGSQSPFPRPPAMTTGFRGRKAYENNRNSSITSLTLWRIHFRSHLFSTRLGAQAYSQSTLLNYIFLLLYN